MDKTDFIFKYSPNLNYLDARLIFLVSIYVKIINTYYLFIHI